MTRYLLDTHALIWWWSAPERLPPALTTAIADRGNTIFISAISGLEIAIKVRIGQLPSMHDRIGVFDTAIRDEGFRHLAIEHHHAIRAGLLPGPHRDPFDRILAAQASLEDMTVVSRDPEIADLGCKVFWS